MKVETHPFRHAVIDGLFPPALVAEAAASWPAPGWPGWNARYDSPVQVKRACDRWEVMPEPCRELLRRLAFLDVSPFGMGTLVPDLGLWGGGMHALSRGGRLGRHLDADHHRLCGLPRRLNAVLFLNAGWRPEWGGCLEFFAADSDAPAVSLAPGPGRLVLFEVSDRAHHGVSGPLACPEGVERMTLACWWYSAPDGREGSRPHAAFAPPPASALSSLP